MSTATATPRPNTAPRHSMARTLNLIACGWCERIRLERGWVSAMEAVVQLRSFEHPLPPSFTVTTCATCRSRVERRRTAARGDAYAVRADAPTSEWSHAA